MTSVADFLAGFVAGYWQGYDFAIEEPDLAGEEEVDVEGGSATGGADAPTTAPAPDPSSRRFAPGPPTEGAPKGPEGSRASAVESLPAIRQPALPAGCEVAGEIERIHAHRGMVIGLASMAELLAQLGHTEAAQLCLAKAKNVSGRDEVQP